LIVIKCYKVISHLKFRFCTRVPSFARHQLLFKQYGFDLDISQNSPDFALTVKLIF